MKPIVTSEQMKKAESFTIDQIGLPSPVLMEKAAEKVFELSCEILDRTETVCVICGCGNNGGDGMAVARMLHEKGADVSVCIIGNEEHAMPEFKLQKGIYEKLGGIFTSEPDFKCDLIIDAMLGIGINRNVSGRYLEVIENLNKTHKATGNTVISVDIPSGLCADTGIALGCAVEADYTLCLGYTKTGLLLNDGPSYTGKLIRDTIGICSPKEISALEFEHEDVSELIPKRKTVSNKSSYGKVTIVAGSEGMPGAAILAAKASMMSGVGMVKILTDNSVIPTIIAAMPEAMAADYNNTENIMSAIDWCDALLIGPGLGRSSKSEEIFTYVMKNCCKPMVIDADGLYHLASQTDFLSKRSSTPTILTPHPGEFIRLFQTSKDDRMHQNIDFLKEITSKYNMTILAKDHNSLITDGKDVFINTFGTDALATAGTGDVLAGIVLTMLVNCIKSSGSDTITVSQDSVIIPSSAACILASAIHGCAGTLAAKESNEYAVTAGTVLTHIPEAINHFKG